MKPSNTKLLKTLSALLAALMLAAFAGCSLREDQGEAEEPDRNEVAVRVGDEYEITRGEIADQYDYYVQLYTYYGMSAPSTDEEIEAMQDNVVASLVSEKLKLYQAKQMGITLTDELKKQAEEDADADIESYLDEFRAQAESEGATDIDARALEIFQEQLDTAEMGMSVEEFRTYLFGFYGDQSIAAALEEQIKGEVEVADEDVQAYYDDLLAVQKETYTAAPADYLAAAEDYQKSGGDPVLYTPEGYIRVRTITISPSEELSGDYTTLKSALEALEAEYGKKALEALAAQYSAGSAALPDVATGSIENGAEILSEYAEKKAQADEIYEAYVQGARAKAEEAYAKLVSGAAFADVLAEYGEDDLYTTYPSFVETGLLMLREGDTTWDKQLVAAALALEKGAYSGVIQVGDMFYILELVGDEPAGEKPLDEVRDAIKAAALAEKAEEHWNAKLDEWESDESATVYFEDVYRSIGK